MTLSLLHRYPHPSNAIGKIQRISKYDKYVVIIIPLMPQLVSMEASEEIQDFLNSFGNHVKQLRKSQDMTQLDLAVLAEMDVRQIQRIEYGEINTSIGNAYSLAKGLGITISELFQGLNLDKSSQ